MDNYAAGNSIMQYLQEMARSGMGQANQMPATAPGAMPSPRQMPSTPAYNTGPPGGGGMGMSPQFSNQGTGFGNDGIAGSTGWAASQGLTNEALNQYIYDDPTMLIPHAVPGVDPFGPGYRRLADLPWDPQVLYSLAQFGGGGGTGSDSASQFANFLNQMYSGVAGGQYIDFNEVLGMLNAGGDNSQLAYWLNNADPGQVQGFLQGVLGTAAQGLSPFGQNVIYTMMPGMFAQQGADLLQSNPQNRGNINPMDAFNQGLAMLGM
jgi:hypothetical protein